MLSFVFDRFHHEGAVHITERGFKVSLPLRVKYLAQEQNTLSQPGLEPEPLDTPLCASHNLKELQDQCGSR